MEGLIFLLALLVLGVVAVSPILALVALVRTRRAESLRLQISRIEGELAELRRRVHVMQGREKAAAESPPAEPAPAVEQPAPRRPRVPELTLPRPDAPRRPVVPPEVPREPTPPPPELASPQQERPSTVTPGAGTIRPPAAGPPPPTPMRIDWERWIGLRGAATLGGVVLGLASLLFFQYSIEHGWITPTLRVVVGIVTGLGCLIAAEWLRVRDYRFTAEGVGGAGVVVLYAAFWSAHVLFSLIGLGLTLLLMILVTVTCCLLALRHSSQVVAVLGLVGGFATPLLLQGTDRPIGLFGYVLLLDLGLLTVGIRRRWPSLGVLSLVGTVLLQALWIGTRMGPDRLWLGLMIVGVFAVFFAVSGRLVDARERGRWLLGRAGAVLLPFAFALYFAGRAELGERLYPVGILLALLSAAAGWLGREQRAGMYPVGAACGSVAVVGVWLVGHALTPALAWEVAGVGLFLSMVFHAFVEWEPRTVGSEGPAPAATIAASGLFILTIFAAPLNAGVPLWPWLAGWLALAALLWRHATFPDRGLLQIAAALGVGLGITAYHAARHTDEGFPGPALFVGVLTAVSVAIQVVALLRRDAEQRRVADQAAAALPILLLVGLAVSPATASLGAFWLAGGTLLLGWLAVLAATRTGAGILFMGAALATVLVHLAWTWNRPGLVRDPSECLTALLLQGLAVAVFTLWPFLFAGRFAGERWAWYAAALSGPAWFLPLRRLFEARFGDGFIGVLPVLLGALALGAAFRARVVWPAADPMRKSALAWFGAVALGFITVALPLQLDKEWITIGWALEGSAVIALWRRLDHPGLKYFGLALLGGATLRLVANPALLDYYPRSGWRIVNWLLYTYLVPAAALLASAALLRPCEVERRCEWEKSVYAKGKPFGAILAGLGSIAVVFVWINLAIADWYATGTALTWSVERAPARDVTVSIAWALYALLLLGLGMARDTIGLRWLSLGLLIVTIGKVFLYDLGELEDLYRVASLVGLAVSLLLVSLLYQRFVFRKTPSDGS